MIVCAPTGIGTSNINEKLCTPTFKIPVEKYLQYASLSSYTLTLLRKQFENVHTIVIDEISMVSSEVLSFISRLSEIKNDDVVFGVFVI